VNRVLERLDQSLFPEYLRRYVTFRVATLLVLIIAIGFSAIDILGGLEAVRWPPKSMRPPSILVLHAFILAVGFGLIYWTRGKNQYYRFRVLFYGMLFGGLVAEILDFVLLPQH